MFEGLTDRELAIAVVQEMRARSLYGCLFFLPDTGGASVFASSTPPGTVRDLSAAEQLAVFAQVATHAEGERKHFLPKDEPEKKGWVN